MKLIAKPSECITRVDRDVSRGRSNSSKEDSLLLSLFLSLSVPRPAERNRCDRPSDSCPGALFPFRIYFSALETIRQLRRHVSHIRRRRTGRDSSTGDDAGPATKLFILRVTFFFFHSLFRFLSLSSSLSTRALSSFSSLVSNTRKAKFRRSFFPAPPADFEKEKEKKRRGRGGSFSMFARFILPVVETNGGTSTSAERELRGDVSRKSTIRACPD